MAPDRPSPEAAATELAARVARTFEALLNELRVFADGAASPDDSAAPTRLHYMLRRGDRLVSGLKAYAGRQPVASQPVEPLPLLCSTADRLRGVLDRSIELSVAVDNDCPRCLVDPDALDEALLQLVRNARDAMPRGGRLHLGARAGRLPNGGAGVEVSVCDSGVGMSAALAARATELFFTTRENDPLAGLGLAAVAGFARQSGGAVRLQSAPSAGTTVTLCLPAVAHEA